MNFYDFNVKDAQGGIVALSGYRGKVLLIVNTATRCGLTPQYKELQQLYSRYSGQGLEILDFPCNQFRHQAPESGGEIVQICRTKFGTQFKIFDKIEVNGANAHPLYVYLKSRQPNDRSGHRIKDWLLKLAATGMGHEDADIKWNFTKFLINREGEVVGRFAPTVTPLEMEKEIQALL
ncbi:glutathione peroxidase [Neisseria animaloris]|uniref:glutathione peroxidase n=1 Tax=Neisseria animaloris TaxID=326522 RepID=UPI000A191F75|nr:glutathione peroxidase [Neisseria animaloris]OSI07663.1 glutathione peroxidase [Neisseria animaloris]VEH88289.1 glutathione peroxidase [Neisseria animaloris]